MLQMPIDLPTTPSLSDCVHYHGLLLISLAEQAAAAHGRRDAEWLIEMAYRHFDWEHRDTRTD